MLNEMQRAGVIGNYALFGATAQMRYTEPVATLDADVLVAVDAADRLDVLGGVYEFCATKGYRPEGEAIRVGAWPAQFVPAFSPLTREAMEQADTADFESIPLRVVRADYLAVIALSVGREGLRSHTRPARIRQCYPRGDRAPSRGARPGRSVATIRREVPP